MHGNRNDVPGDAIERGRRYSQELAGEIIEHFYQALLALPPIRLKDGTTVTMESYYKPEVDDDGDPNCGVDVRLEDGSHLEFTLANTGWGRSFVTDYGRGKPGPRGR